ncbi:hypothetical protein [Pseudomonas sp. nanlin1]|uniref:hypothetical protein n=1 Tax=Pseudomonas sp. nanlin1 TaxID=3040605 RepID=UPI00388FA15A
MNSTSESVSQSALSRESMQMLARWLKSNGGASVNKVDPRRSMLERYPAGLLTEAEMDALAGVFRRAPRRK